MKTKIAVAMSLFSVVVLTAGASAVGVPALTRVSGPSPYANCTIGGPGTNYVNAEVEPYVAVNPTNPRNVVGVWQQDRWSNGAAHGDVAGFSFDGGHTWGETTLPFSQCAGGLSYPRASDPWVSIGPDGTIYTTAVDGDGIGPRAVVAATSSDGGKSWTNLNVIASATSTQFFNDKSTVTADPTKAGVAYSVWVEDIAPNANPDADLHAFAFTGPGLFSKTTDGGKTWSTPRVIFPTAERNQTLGSQIVVAPDGTLYDFTNWIIQPVTLNKERDQIAFVKSSDGGATWSAPKAVRDMDAGAVTDPNTGAPIRTADSIPEMAIDPATGKLYVAWQTTDFSGGAHSDVALISSSDGGATWSAAIQVNTPQGEAAFTPTIKVSSNGTVGVTYYDFRNLPVGDTTTLPTDYWFKSSSNGGVSFSADTHIAGSFDMLIAPFADGFFLGDYEGMGTTGPNFQPFFVQTNSGNLANRTDIFTTTLTP